MTSDQEIFVALTHIQWPGAFVIVGVAVAMAYVWRGIG